MQQIKQSMPNPPAESGAERFCQQTSNVTDKWQLHQWVSDGAEALGITYRQVEVLRALLTFYPERNLDAGKAIVFPSNATLSRRLGGMPESTLRRHLSKLVASGLIDRRDSPNRKRYAKRTGHVFGFDLAPLLLNAGYLCEIAQATRETALRLETLRDDIRQAVKQNSEIGEDDASVVFKMLRRRLDEQALNQLLETVQPNDDLGKMSGNDSENERHTYPEEKKSVVENDSFLVVEALEHCTRYHGLIETRRHFDPFSCIEALSLQIGLSTQSVTYAMRELGWQRMLAILVVVIERQDHIKNHVRYVQAMFEKAKRNTLNLRASIRGIIAEKQRLSADNFISNRRSAMGIVS